MCVCVCVRVCVCSLPFDFLIDCFFLIDIVLNFNTGTGVTWACGQGGGGGDVIARMQAKAGKDRVCRWPHHLAIIVVTVTKRPPTAAGPLSREGPPTESPLDARGHLARIRATPSR